MCYGIEQKVLLHELSLRSNKINIDVEGNCGQFWKSVTSSVSLASLEFFIYIVHSPGCGHLQARPAYNVYNVQHLIALEKLAISQLFEPSRFSGKSTPTSRT